MIIVSGENIYPSEIENCLSKFKKITLGIVSSIPNEITQNTLILVYESKQVINNDEIYNFLKLKLSKIQNTKKNC